MEISLHKDDQRSCNEIKLWAAYGEFFAEDLVET